MSDQTKKSNAGNLYLIFLGLFLILMGSLFTLLMWFSFQRGLNTRNWQATPATITLSQKDTKQVEGHNREFRWLVNYEYQANGKSYTSDKHTLRKAKWSKHEEEIDKLVESHPLGMSLDCFVDPNSPSSAILKHDSLGAGYSIWFPMLFAVGGGGMIVGAIRKWNK